MTNENIELTYCTIHNRISHYFTMMLDGPQEEGAAPTQWVGTVPADGSISVPSGNTIQSIGTIPKIGTDSQIWHPQKTSVTVYMGTGYFIGDGDAGTLIIGNSDLGTTISTYIPTFE